MAERKLTIPPKCVLVVFGTIASKGSTLRHLRNVFHKTVDRHVAADGLVFVQCYDKSDPLQSFANRANFKPVSGGFANFDAREFLPMHNSSCPPALWELGDHADNDIAIQSTIRKKAPDVQEWFDDCGDDVSQIELSGESSFITDHNLLSSAVANSGKMLDTVFDSVFLSWFMQGSDCLDITANPNTQTHETFASAYAVLKTLPLWKSSKKLHDYVELFGGNGGCTKIAIRRGLKGGKNYDLACGIDLSKTSEVKAFFAYLFEFKPYVVIMSPPCTAFGNWSNYNRINAYDTWQAAMDVGLPLAVFAAKVALEQMTHDRHFLCENPWSSHLWKLPCWKAVLQDVRCTFVYCDQCMLGLVDCEGHPTQKATAFVASHELLLRKLNVKCPGLHDHVVLAGSANGMSRTKFAQVWPRRLCETIIDNIIQLMKYARLMYPISLPVAEVCPGCKSHAARGSGTHNRGAGCRFPYDIAEVWTCEACVRHKHVHNPDHTKISGQCRWATALKRAATTRSGDPRVPQSSIVEAPAEEEAEVLPIPPPSAHGSWEPVNTLATCTLLDNISTADGWHTLESGVAFVAHNSRDIRSPEPRYEIDKFPTRSVFAYLQDSTHAHGNWWSLQRNVKAISRTRLEYPVDILVHIFHPAIAESSPVKNKPEEDNPISKALHDWPDDDEEIEIDNKIIPFVPAEPREEGELEALPQALDAQPDAGQALAVPDWSSWDLGRSLRTLRGTSQAHIIRTIRQLHLRWWHASSSRMQSLLSNAGLPKEVIDAVKGVVDTCRVCRLWKRPGDSAIASSRLSLEFNYMVQIDLLFWQDAIVLHMLDTCIKWSSAAIIAGKKPADILPALAKLWFRVFGAPKVIVSDHEGALCGEESSVFLERWGVSLHPKPVGSHAYQVERHNALLRHQLDAVKAQTTLEGLSVSDDDILSESLFAKNTMLQIHGTSPYKALLGRVPEVLREFENPGLSMLSDNLGGDTSRHITRLREISIQQIIEGTAQDRLKRAAHTQTRVAGQLLDLAPGTAVDIYREPKSKDLSGWRGPAEVISVQHLSEGYIDCKWGGRALSVRVADIRKSLVYVQLLDVQDPQLSCILQHLRSLHDCAQVMAFVHSPHGWVMSQHAREHPEVFRAGMFVAYNVFHLSPLGIRLGRGIASLPGLFGTENTVLLWFPAAQPSQYRTMQVIGTQNVNLKQLFGDEWLEICWIQFIGVGTTLGRHLKALAPDEPFVGDNPHQDPDAPMPPAPPQAPEDTHISSSDSEDEPGPMRQWPHPPQPPQPVISNTSTRRDYSMPSNNSRRDQPMSSNNSRGNHSMKSSTPSTLPPVPPPDHAPPTKRSRSAVSSGRRAINTDSTSSSALPPGWSHVSRKIPGVVPKSSARNSTQYGGSQASTWHTPVSHNVPAPVILPVHHDIHTDDEHPASEAADSMPSTMPCDDEEELYPYDMFFGKVPPTPHMSYVSNCSCEAAMQQQLLYLSEFSKPEGPYAPCFYADLEPDEVEFEISPEMCRFFEGAPEIAADEVYVFIVGKGAKGKVKRMIQKNLDNLTAQDVKDNWAEVEAAIRKEIKSFIDMKTFESVLRKVAVNICTSRWVHKFKMIDGRRVVKSRLTIRGFQDLALDLNTFASTASRWGQRLVLSVCVQRLWTLFTWDVSSAFLQGLTFQEIADMSKAPIRAVAFTPPIGSEKYFVEMLGTSVYNPLWHVLNCLKAIYGLRDAPKAWKSKLHLVLCATGGRPLHTDASLYVWFIGGCLQMVLSTHVDDLKGGGEQETVRKVQKSLEQNFGALKIQESSFEHCGIQHLQSSDCKTIRIHQNHYVEQLQAMDITAVALGSHDADLSLSHIADYQSLLGGLSWTVQTRMDVAIYVCSLQRAAKKPKVEHAVRLNKVLKWCRRKEAFITYKQLEPPCRLLSISDSAFRKEDKTGLAMRGAIIAVASAKDPGLSGLMHVIEYYARKQRRVTRSTYSAELNAASDAYEFAKLIALTLAELVQPCPQASMLTSMEENGSLPIAVHLIIDARSVFDSLRAEEIRPPTEISLVMMLCQLKEAMLTHTLKGLHWVDTHDMLADGLNKGACSRESLVKFGQTGEWNLLHKPISFSETRHVPILSVRAAVTEAFVAQLIEDNSLSLDSTGVWHVHNR